MQKQGRYLVLITLLFILEDIVLLNLLFFVLFYQVFKFGFDETYHIVLILINLGYLLSFAVIQVDFNDVKQLHIPHLIRRSFYKLAITAFILISCLFFLKESSFVSRVFIFTFFSTAYVFMVVTQWITRLAAKRKSAKRQLYSMNSRGFCPQLR